MGNDTQKLEKTTPYVPNKEEDDERQKQVFPQPLVITLPSVQMCVLEHFPLLFKVTKVNKQSFTIAE